MALPVPNLDDRTFDQLLAKCRQQLSSCPKWTDLSPNDPGIVLLELFAHLTEVMIFRLNRVPEKVYVELLRLLGVKLIPPSAASAKALFRLAQPLPHPFDIPRATRLTLGRATGGGEAPVFITAQPVTIPPGENSAEVMAYHCEFVGTEVVGRGTGMPGLSVRVKRAPIIAPIDGHLDLVVGVETEPAPQGARMPAFQHNSRTYRIWREVEDFISMGDDPYVYVVDRMMGIITFAPAVRRTMDGSLENEVNALAAIPPEGREIVVSYCRGGGVGGNVGAGLLTILKDPLPGITVTNPQAAAGGMNAETLANALARGPIEVHSLHRAVTAGDYETIACREAGLVARAKAFTKAEIWTYAAPGTVQVLLVPAIPVEERVAGRVTDSQLAARQTDAARDLIKRTLDKRRPLGATCEVSWVRYKTVTVCGRIIVREEEDSKAVKERVLRRLHGAINPLPDAEIKAEGWRFGQSLGPFFVYDIILGEPGVVDVEDLRLLVDSSPDHQVAAVAADAFQPRTWYAGSAERLFRSTNDCGSWETCGSFPGELVKIVKAHPSQPGCLALITSLPAAGRAHRVYFSSNCGASWKLISQTSFTVDDVAWLYHEKLPSVLLATDAGLYGLNLAVPGATPVQILVDPADQNLGFYAVTITDGHDRIVVMTAARDRKGIFISDNGGKDNTFQPYGLQGEDVRVLEAQKAGPRRFVWAGLYNPEFDSAKGCRCRELWAAEAEWTAYDRNWKGSCTALAFAKDQVLATTDKAGVVRLNTAQDHAVAEWQRPSVNSQLPLAEVDRFQRVEAISASPDGSHILAGGPLGVFLSLDDGVNYTPTASREFKDEAALPDTWLFCSGEHQITVATIDETRRH